MQRPLLPTQIFTLSTLFKTLVMAIALESEIVQRMHSSSLKQIALPLIGRLDQWLAECHFSLQMASCVQACEAWSKPMQGSCCCKPWHDTNMMGHERTDDGLLHEGSQLVAYLMQPCHQRSQGKEANDQS